MTEGPAAAADARSAIRTGDVLIDLRGHEVRRGGERVHVEPQVFDVIAHLLANAGRLVPKEELLDAVWGTRFVSESSLTSRIKAARRALGDDGRVQRVIQTVHGRGYRWVAPVDAVEASDAIDAADAAAGDVVAASRPADPASRRHGERPALPVALTPFIGRRQELEDVLAAVRAHRLVTATGPGGIGKTRLALAAAEVLAADRRDGVAFADLVEVTEPSMVIAAVADAVGVSELAGTSRRDALVEALLTSDCLIVVDNCEHVVDAARDCIEDLLATCPEVRVLATSRLRLMLPFERVYPVPGLSLGERDASEADAVELFAARMVAAGAPPTDDPADADRIRELCRVLDGIALAIELAAARVPSVGLDGLTAALGSQLDLLSTLRASDHRHRSLHAAIDWTYRLLDADERAVLRAAAVFAAPFDADALAAVTGRTPPAALTVVARLVDWNLVARHGASRFRVLETIRQFATEDAEALGEGERLRTAHLDWARARLETVLAEVETDRHAIGDPWRRAVDAVLPDARGALAWSMRSPAVRDATGLATLLATVCYQRGHPGEAQQRFEEAAAAAEDPAARHRALRLAAGAAAARNVGADALRLLEEAAAAASAAGRPDDAAVDLATAAMYCHRASGIIAHAITPDDAARYLAAARACSTGGLAAQAAIANGEEWGPDSVARSLEGAERAVELARRSGDRLLESAALDLLTAAQLHDLDAAASSVRLRRALLAGGPVDARGGFELYDTYHMSCQIDLARGDFQAARAHADVVAALPFFREARHVGLGRRMEVDSMAGAFDDAVRHGELFERDWTRAGRPRAGNLAVGCYALAMVHGVLGDDERRAHWMEIAAALLVPAKRYLLVEPGWGPTLDSLVDLHRGDPDAAVARLGTAADAAWARENPNRALWRPWYAAAWVEAAVLAGLDDAGERVRRAMPLVRANPVASALVDRARLLLERDVDAVRDGIHRRLLEAGSAYQAQRSLDLADALA